MINVIITTKNGASGSKQFRNMAQGLAYAYANGVYHAALKIEFIDMDEALNIKANDEKKDVKKDEKPAKKGNEDASTPNVINNKKDEKTLEQMSKKELIELAKTLNIKVGVFDNDVKIIAAILEAEVKGEKLDNQN